jgi:putative two-component system response regulator
MMGNSSDQTILIVDDVNTNIDLLVNILGEQYDIAVATDGETALERANEGSPDLILLDVMMPGMDGYEVCRRLKANISTRNIPVIFVTAMGEVKDEMHGFELGAVDYITKPISPPIVEARVKTHLALYDQNRVLDEKVRQRTTQLNETRLEIIRRLGRASEFKDEETGLHIVRMSYYSQLISLAYGVSAEHAELILNAAPMHDVGKIGIPDRILLKPGKLDAEEWKVMQTHTSIGTEIIGDHDSELLKVAGVIAISHHEKWNGKGYPNGTRGENIPLEGRIIAIADVFDALTSERPYKKAWTVEKAVDLIQSESGEHFDPALVDAFMEALPEILEIKGQYGDRLSS